MLSNEEALKKLEDCSCSSEMREAINVAIKAVDLLIRLEGFKYVTTSVMLKENELAHFDIYKRGWNDAIEAVKVASNRPLSEIINSIKETEAVDGYKEADSHKADIPRLSCFDCKFAAVCEEDDYIFCTKRNSKVKANNIPCFSYYKPRYTN